MSTSTRNFPNRLGIDTNVFLGSAELAAVCALMGRIPTPAEYLSECGWLDGGTTMILQALAFPEEAKARWEYLYSADNFGDAAYAEEITTDPMDMAEALEARGIKTAVFLGKGDA